MFIGRPKSICVPKARKDGLRCKTISKISDRFSKPQDSLTSSLLVTDWYLQMPAVCDDKGSVAVGRRWEEGAGLMGVPCGVPIIDQRSRSKQNCSSDEKRTRTPYNATVVADENPSLYLYYRLRGTLSFPHSFS